MKKTLIKALAVVATAVAARTAMAAADSYLYWMVSDEVVNAYHGIDVSGEWQSTKVKVGESYLSWYNQGATTPGNGTLDGSFLSRTDSSSGTIPLYWGLFDSSDLAQTITFELYSERDGTGEVVEYWATTLAALSDSIFSGTGASGASAYALASVVPEPTSGMLLLLGLAGLALRRKRSC